MRDDEFVKWIESPSGRARISVTDGLFCNGKWKDGSVFLQPPNQPIIEIGGFKRPNEAVINDAGFAAIADWLSFDKLEGMIFFVRPDGSISMRHKFNVNLGRLALEPNGNLVFATTAASEHEDAKLLCFNLQNGELIWSKLAPKPAAEILVVPGEEFVLVGRPYISCGSDYILKISFKGDVLEKWPDSPYQAIDMGESEREAGRTSKAERWFQLAAHADIPATYRARAYRALGEIAEFNGCLTDALNFHTMAIGLDPKCGVKRKIEELKRVLR